MKRSQPYGIIHGGANIVLAESLGSIACAHVIDVKRNLFWTRGKRITYKTQFGFATGVAKPCI